MNGWQSIYSWFNPVALDLGLLKIHWYGLMYVLALLSVYLFARWLATKDKYPFSTQLIDSYFFWAEIGVILGGRLGFVLFYDSHTSWYLSHPWQIFNPFMDGTFVGIRGFSYHGGLAGFVLVSAIFAYMEKLKFWLLMDLVAVSTGLGYTFGRIGNFLNQELVGRATDVPWGIFVEGAIRHPSTLYEAFFEGIAVFALLYAIRHKKSFDGQLAMIYGMLYGLARFGCEFFRQPDFQLGFLYGEWLTMGMVLSLATFALATGGYMALKRSGSAKQI